MLHSLSFDVLATLESVRRGLGIGRIERWAVRGLALGGMMGIVLLALARLWPFSSLLPLSLAFLVGGALAGVLWGIRQWPSSLETARVVDRYFGLHDRLTTALEFRAADDPVSTLQRSEAAHRLKGLKLQDSSRGQLAWREIALAGFVILALAVLLLISNAPSVQRRVAPPNPDQQRIHHIAAIRVPTIARKLEHSLSADQRQNPALRKLEGALARLQQQLMHTPSRATALRRISVIQQQLHHLAATLHPISPKAVSPLNHSLSRYMTAQQRTAAQSSERKALAAAAQTLSHLARALNHLTAAQRNQLGRALEQAANAASDSRLRALLRQAASSLAYNDAQAARSALQQAASALKQTPSARATQAALNAASSQLDSLKNDISGVSKGTSSQTAGTGSGKSGQGSGQGKGGSGGHGSKRAGGGKGSGRGQGKGHGSGNGQSNSRGSGHGQGTGSGHGHGQGSDHGSGSGSGRSGGPGGHGLGGGRGGAGPHGRGRYHATVYVPTKEGKGSHMTQTGPRGAPLRGALLPYQEVLAQYEQTAHAELDRSALPPALRNYVRRYFAAISH
jgi:ribosomal protein S20